LVSRFVRREERETQITRPPLGCQEPSATSQPACASAASAFLSWPPSPLAWAGVLPLPALTPPLPPLPRPKAWLSSRLCQRDLYSQRMTSQLVRFVVEQGVQLRELQRVGRFQVGSRIN
jgi:hypothetical protein